MVNLVDALFHPVMSKLIRISFFGHFGINKEYLWGFFHPLYKGNIIDYSCRIRGVHSFYNSCLTITASRLKVSTVLEWALSYYHRSFTIWRKIYALWRLICSPFKLLSKEITKILPSFCNNKTVPTLRQCPFWVVKQ